MNNGGAERKVKCEPRSQSRSRSRSRSTGRDVLEICWKPVREDPQNFDAWTHLLQCVENLDDTKAAREAFDSFLSKFPYCFGYWKKYAEMERRHKHYERCIEVYEKGITAIALSVDLWISYLVFYKDHVKDSESKDRRIRQLYERALTAAGLDFRSDKLWEDYISWETVGENYQNVLQIYDRLCKVPTLLYSTQFDRLQEFVNKFEPHEILSQTEFDKLYKEIESSLHEMGQEMFVVDESQDHAINADGDLDSSNVSLKKKYNDEALKMFRVKILDRRRKHHLKTELEVSKRWNFEEAIKRPYFHVKPLERAQLKNWRHYLDFEMSEGNHERIKVLFERCLIACAMYEDIWIRYARYAETIDNEEARQIYKRACQIHLLKKPNPHLVWVTFEEKLGHFDYAKGILTSFDLDNPGLVLIQMRRLGLEMRQALAEAKSSSNPPNFSDLCRRYENLILDAKSPPKVATFYAIKYARFQAKIRKDKRLAEKILLDALARNKNNVQLHNQLIHLAYEQEPFCMDDVLLALDRALDSSDLSEMDKLQFSQRKLEILEDLSDDAEMIQRHYESHIKMYKGLGFSSSKKRPTDSSKDEISKKIKPETQTMPAIQHAATGATAAYPPNYYDYYYQQHGYTAGAVGQGPSSVSSQSQYGRTYGYYASSSSHQPYQ